jgi:hypothetical protein
MLKSHHANIQVIYICIVMPMLTMRPSPRTEIPEMHDFLIFAGFLTIVFSPIVVATVTSRVE